MKSLYQRIGGDDAVLAAVNRFYLKVTRDERTKGFFIGLAVDVDQALDALRRQSARDG